MVEIEEVQLTALRCSLDIANHDLAQFRAGRAWPTPIAVSERLPEKDVPVLAFVLDGDGSGRGGWLRSHIKKIGFWHVGPAVGIIEQARITHWLPLPPSPQPVNG